MVIKLIQLLFLGSCLIANTVLADSIVPPKPTVTTHPYCSCYFTMIPAQTIYDDQTKEKISNPPYGKAYQLNDDGSSTIMWEVSDWYSYENYLSWDGRYLVRMGDWPSGDKPSKDHMAVTFYDQGVELKSYSTADLIKNPRKVKRTISHYFWLASDSNYPRIEYKNNFHLKTIDGYVHIFDMENGELIESKNIKNDLKHK